MGRMIDLSEQRFGRLVAIKPLPKDPLIKDRSIKWLCKCDCGNEIAVSGSNLRTGHTQSCGCLQKEKASSRLVDLTNQHFGKLTVKKLDTERNKQDKQTYWICECDCGNITSIYAGSLQRGLTKSCGCLKQSYGTFVIEKFLQELNLPYTKEYYVVDKNGNKFYFDYYVNNEYIIEFDGQQHFQSTAGWNSRENVINTHKKDLIKNQYCFKNNIPLIRICYKEQDNIQATDLLIDSKFLITKANEQQYYDKYYKEK